MSTERRLLLESKGLALYAEVGPPYRELWLSGEFQVWSENELCTTPPPQSDGGRWRGTDEPIDQVYAAFQQYAYDPAFKAGSIWINITPQHKGVFEIKTPDVRVFGWFYSRGVFIGHKGAFKATVDYPLCRASVETFRLSLQLPYLHIAGGKPRDYL